jgi:hypothetical protein
VADITVVQVTTSDATVLSEITDVTILVAAPATLVLPDTIELSDDDPLELANTASAGTSAYAARADHRHPTTGMFINGGNF